MNYGKIVWSLSLRQKYGLKSRTDFIHNTIKQRRSNVMTCNLCNVCNKSRKLTLYGFIAIPVLVRNHLLPCLNVSKFLSWITGNRSAMFSFCTYFRSFFWFQARILKFRNNLCLCLFRQIRQGPVNDPPDFFRQVCHYSGIKGKNDAE